MENHIACLLIASHLVDPVICTIWACIIVHANDGTDGRTITEGRHKMCIISQIFFFVVLFIFYILFKRMSVNLQPVLCAHQ